MTNQILITIAREALRPEGGPGEPQRWQCTDCGATMDIVDGLAHILYDCPLDPTLAEYTCPTAGAGRHVKEQWANRPDDRRDEHYDD